MITTDAKKRIDDDLVCIECGKSPMMQPLDLDPCVDEWWCGNCEKYLMPLLLGKYPLCVIVNTNGESGVIKQVCTGERVTV